MLVGISPTNKNSIFFAGVILIARKKAARKARRLNVLPKITVWQNPKPRILASHNPNADGMYPMVDKVNIGSLLNSRTRPKAISALYEVFRSSWSCLVFSEDQSVRDRTSSPWARRTAISEKCMSVSVLCEVNK